MNSHTCHECYKRFNSQNPAMKNGEIVCWDCSEFDIMGEKK